MMSEAATTWFAILLFVGMAFTTYGLLSLAQRAIQRVRYGRALGKYKRAVGGRS